MSSESESDASAPPARWRGVRPRARPQLLSSPGSPAVSSSSSVEPPRRKRYRIEQSSTSSATSSSEDNNDDSIIGIPSTSRRCRRLESDDTDQEMATQPVPKPKISTTPDGQSDSSDGESDKCPICLLKMSNRQVGTPNTCEHFFCVDCLLEWSSHVNTCPVDRKEFTSIQVREKVGGYVIKMLTVESRYKSIDRYAREIEIVEFLTRCEICQGSDSEETMLLCDMCDLGYHMECLNPPLQEIPAGDWFCPTCSIQRIDDGLPSVLTPDTTPLSNGMLQSQQSNSSNSASATTNSLTAPSTSSQSNGSRPTSTRGTRQTAGGRVARKKRTTRRKRRRTKNIVMEYEIRDGEKFPSKTKRVTKKRRKKKAKRTSRTAARRTLVRSSVRGRLKELFKTIIGSSMSSREPATSNIVAPQLSLFGNGNELDFFSDDEDYGYSMGGGTAAVAVAPRFRTSAIIDAHRQARRKTIAMSSPTYASSAPDLLSSILESQTLLHSKSTSLSVKGDGTLIIDAPKHIEHKKDNTIIEKQEKINILESDSSSLAKETPAYGGTGRGGGNWRGGRNDYQGGGNQNRNSRPYNSGNYQSSGPGNYRDNNNYNNEGFSSQSNSYYSPGNAWSNNNTRNQREQFSNFRDRSPQQRLNANNRGRGAYQRFSPQVSQRPRGVPQWQPQNYSDMSQSYNEQQSSEPYPSDNYPETDENNSRVSTAVENNSDSNFNADAVSSDSLSSNRQFGNYEVTNESSQGNVPPQPSIIRFQKPTLSDDENDDSKIASDGDKYDPTEPTLDDSSSDDETAKPINVQHKITIVSPPRPAILDEFEPPSPAAVQDNERHVNITPEILDGAVQQLIEHGELLKASSDKDDNESDGECPNFSIYSSTSIDIAKSKKESMENEMKQQIKNDHEDLVQEDDGENEINLDHAEVINEPLSSPEAQEDIAQTVKLIEEIKTITESESSLSRPQLVVKSKFIPKRNVIKINLSSNLGIKKRIMDSENKEIKNDDDVPQCSSTLENDIKIDDAYITNQIKRVKIPHLENLKPRESDKFTESISDVEDERSYTPCLDENKSNKSKDTSIEDEKANSGIEGLDTELISEDEGNELFSEHNNHSLNSERGNAEMQIREAREQPGECEEGEIIEKNKQKIKAKVKELLEKTEEKISDDDKKKKRREKKTDKDDKEKSTKSRNKKDEDMSFKKLTKSGKERNYRDRDDKNKKGRDRRRSKSTDKENKERKLKDKKREKRKDIERYDVRNIISDRSRRLKDAFGRDKSRPNSPDSRQNSPNRYRSPLSKRRTASRSPSQSPRSVSKRRSPSVSKKRSPSITKRQSPSISKRRSPSITKRRSISVTRRHSLLRTNRSRSKSIPPKSPQKQTNKRSDDSRRKRSISRGRRSLSNNRRTPSPRNKRSPSPKRRSVSPKMRKSISPRRRSMSTRNRSPLLRHRRSISPRMRRSISPRLRRSKSLHTRRSISRTRNKRFKRSVSRGRRPSPRMIQRNKSPIRRRLSRRSISRNRSRSPKLKKIRKTKRNRSNSSVHKSKSPIKHKMKRKRLQSYSPVRLSRSMSREHLHHAQWQVPEKSPLFQDWTSGSQSMSPVHVSPGWTPPPMEKSPEPRNLRVILTTKEKPKKKDKKKKSNKRNKASDRVLKHQSKDLGPSKEVFTSGNNILVSLSFNKNKDTNHIPSMMPSDIIPKKKKRKAEAAAKQKKDKNREKIKKRRLEKEKRTREIENKKPVAIIDLDKSPFKELTPSPKAVIVLSDSDTEEKEDEVVSVRQESNTNKLAETEFPQSEIQSLPSSPSREATYVVPAGPKTPPEPSVKFTIVSKSNPQLRAVNPLHEEEDETVENPETAATEDQQNRVNEALHKGPNTPPDPPNSPPSSPDAYDPFEPTKSGTPTPERVASPQPALEIEKLIENRLEEINNIPSMSLEAAQKSNLSADDVIQAKPLSPTEKVLALLKSTRANSPITSMQQLFGDQLFDNLKSNDNDIFPPMVPAALQSPEKINTVLGVSKVSQAQSTFSAVVKPNSPKPIYSTVTPTVVTSTPVYLNPVPRIGVYTMGMSPQRSASVLPQKITLPSPTKSSPLKTQPSKMFMNKPSPIKSTPIKPILSKNVITKLPLPTIKPLPQPRAQKMPPKNQNKPGQNGSEVINVEMDMDSPYSPGSSDFGDLFEPPADNGKHTAAVPLVVGYQPQKAAAKYDPFENIFNMKPAVKNSGKTKVTVQQIKKPKKMSSSNYKVDEVSLKILEELPSSAVEMQVKAKYLKKLNRQERVVEEVKVVLKPHYARKHISKEEYKEILRRAVPKICHNRSGEINPAKIHALIEAYVKKFRKKLLTVK